MLSTNDFVLVFGQAYKTKKHLNMIKIHKTFKTKNVCTSYQGPPTEHPLEIPNLNLLRNPVQHKRSHQLSTSMVEAIQKKYHHI
jgi:hypothetical protein